MYIISVLGIIEIKIHSYGHQINQATSEPNIRITTMHLFKVKGRHTNQNTSHWSQNGSLVFAEYNHTFFQQQRE